MDDKIDGGCSILFPLYLVHYHQVEFINFNVHLLHRFNHFNFIITCKNYF